MIHADKSQFEDPTSAYNVPQEDFPTEDPTDVIEQDDGSAIIPNMDPQQETQAFDDNLAESVDSQDLKELASSLLDSIEDDQKARERRDKQYEEGIRRTGLGDDAPGGAQFSGASKVVHPVLAESCIDFASRAIKELFPAGGPVKMQTSGLVTDPQQDKQIKQLCNLLNDQFTNRIAEYRGELEKELTQLPLGGSQFMKLYWSTQKNRICAEFVSIDNIFIPFYATSFYDSERVTHRQYPDRPTYEARVKSGQYIDTKRTFSSTDPEFSATARANEKIEGKTSSGFNEDGVRIVYEVYTWLELDDDSISQGERSPYIVSVDEYDQQILSIRRNWDEQDQTRQKLDWIVEDVFIYWMGAYGIGLPHLIGGLSAAATGSLRALLDSAHINNAPTLLKLKGAKINGQNQQVQVTQIAEIEGPVGIDDIRKYIMPMPFNAPSQVLFSLLGWLTDAAKGVVSTASEKIADATSNTPVGTVQALIEQGAVIFSSIHSRLHFSQAKKFSIVLRLLKTYGQQELQTYGLDPTTVTLKGVIPVSDPRLFSEAQRFAQMQGVLQLAASDPSVPYNKAELHRAMLELMKVDNIDKLLPPPQQPQPADPAKELISWISGAPVVVAPEQDHMSHIIAHVNYLKDPICGMNPIMVAITAKLLDHLREHIGMFFASRMMQSVPQQPPLQSGPMGIVGRMPMQPPQQPPDAMMAQASVNILSQDDQIAQEALEIIKQVDEFVKNNMPPTPETMAIKMQADVAKMEIERKTQADQAAQALKQTKQENDQKSAAFKLEMEQKDSMFRNYLKKIEQEQQHTIANLSQQVELMKNDQDNRTKQLIDLVKNQDDNRTAILIAKIKEAMASNPEKDPGPNIQLEQIQSIIDRASSSQVSDQMRMIMEGLQETIHSSRAPRKTTPILDENGDIIGATSEITQ